MESVSQVALSLDELTLDLSEDVGAVNGDNFNDYDITSDKKNAVSTPPNGTETPFVNLNFILQDLPQEHPVEEEKHGEEAEQEISENEVVNETREDEIDITPISAIAVSDEQNENFEAEPEDFEVDVPPLSLFTSQKNDDSDDSEFEVPEPNQTIKTPSNANAEHKNFTPSNNLSPKQTGNNAVDTQIILQTNEQNEVIDKQIHSAKENDLEPEILTPREKVFSDLPTALLLREDLEKEKTSISEETSHGLQNLSAFPSSAKECPVDTGTCEDRDSDRGPSAKPSIVTTAEDWEGIQTVEPGFADSSRAGSGAASVIESKPLASYSQCLEQMAAMDYSGVKNNIKSHIERHGFSAFTHLLFGPPKLHKDLLPQRDMAFCIAATSFDNDKDVHNRILQTVYRYLTGSKFDCQRYGGHWEEIGFQGRDPATDLRGTGMLSLLHILYFLRDPLTKTLARDIYKLSLHPTQNFPFCIMGINVTRICLQVFREDAYNKECNRQKDVMGTMNQVYGALFLHLFLLWKKGKTIADSGFVLQEVESYSRKHSKDVFKDLQSYEKKWKQEGLFGEHPESNPSFLDVCKEDKCDNKINAELY